MFSQPLYYWQKTTESSRGQFGAKLNLSQNCPLLGKSPELHQSSQLLWTSPVATSLLEASQETHQDPKSLLFPLFQKFYQLDYVPALWLASKLTGVCIRPHAAPNHLAPRCCSQANAANLFLGYRRQEPQIKIYYMPTEVCCQEKHLQASGCQNKQQRKFIKIEIGVN